MGVAMGRSTSPFVIASGAATGDAVSLNPPGKHRCRALMGIVLPAAATNTEFSLQGDFGDGTLRDIQAADGTALTVSFTADAYVWLDPAITAGCEAVALTGSGNEAAERSFSFVVREVE